MADFSWGEATGSGFRLIARHPLAILAWTLVYLLFVVVPSFALLAHALPQLIDAMHSQGGYGRHAGRPDPAAIMAFRQRNFGLQPALWLLSIAVNSVVISAIFRAVLRPEARSWSYLRLGAEELWTGLSYLVFIFVAIILFCVLAFPMAIAVGLVAGVSAHGHGSPTPALALLAAIGVIGACAIFWVLIRLCLALPMSFAERRFRLYESWDLTRGHAFKIFLVFLALMIGLILLEILLVSAAAYNLLPRVHGVGSWDSLTEGGIGASLRRLGPTLALLAVVGSVIGMAVHAITVAPLAVIYRRLSAEAPAAS
jgi:hypothetical protein